MARLLCPGAALFGIVGVLGIVTLTGCGGNPAVVKGTVTVDGVPASDGSVNFEPADGQGPSAGAKVTDGTYEVPSTANMTPGKKRVVIRASVKTGKQIAVGPPAPPGTMMDELKFYPPPKGKPDIQEVEVKSGRNDLPFALTSSPEAKKK